MENEMNLFRKLKEAKLSVWFGVLMIALVAGATSYNHRMEMRGIERRANAVTTMYRTQDSIKQLLLATRDNQTLILLAADVVRLNQSIIIRAAKYITRSTDRFHREEEKRWAKLMVDHEARLMDSVIHIYKFPLERK